MPVLLEDGTPVLLENGTQLWLETDVGVSVSSIIYNFSFQPPKLQAPRDLIATNQHAAEIARSLRQFPEIVAALNAMSARIAALEGAGGGGGGGATTLPFLLEDGTTLWLEDSTPMLLEA